MKKMIFLLLSLLLVGQPVYALPGKQQFSIKKTDYTLYFINNYDSLVVLKMTKANFWGSNAQCGVFPLKNKVANVDGTIVSFEDKDYGLFNGMRHFYDDNKIDLILYQDICGLVKNKK